MAAGKLASLEAASAHVAGMKADLGGTELLPALQFVLEQKGSAELPRQVVVLTDGEVSNTDAIIALAAAHAADTRIFTFGIGAGASHHLVRGLARAGGGTAEFIHPGERIEPKVLRQLARLLAPALTDVGVEWAGGTVTQAPQKIAPVFAGGRLLVYGLVKGARPASVRLTATGPSGPLSFDVPVPEAASASLQTVATLAARARIRELEEGSDWLSARGSQQKDRKASSTRNEIIALSLRYGVMSRETSFVAVERRDTPVTGDVRLRKVPIALTKGWGGGRFRRLELGLSVPDLADSYGAPPTAAMERLSSPSPTGRIGRLFSRAKRRTEVDAVRAKETGVTVLFQSAPPSPGKPAPAGMHALILLQGADGSWELTQELASIIGRDLGALRSAVKGATGLKPELLRAWATALALAWLGRNAADVEDEWRLLAAKAQRWIVGTAVVPPGGGTWLDEAKGYLG